MLNQALNGKILNVRLSSGVAEPEEIPEKTYREYLGGYGLGVRLLFDRIPQGADPLGPDNILGFFPGLLTGTPLFGIRYQAVAKSPKSGGWGDANCGGDFGPFLKHAGWDGLLIYGAAENPVYILIDDDKVEIKDASDLWGMLAIDVEDTLKERHGKKASVACIGPAGENLSYMAGICNERGRLAARSGLGAVMGSKKVKAIVCLASRNILAGDSKDVRMMVRQSLDEFVKPVATFFRNYGTTGITAGSAMSGDSPVKNWGGVGSVDFPDAGLLSGDNFNAKMDKRYACWHCPLACGAESNAWDEQESAAQARIAKRVEERTKLQSELSDGADEERTKAIQAAIQQLDQKDASDGQIKNNPKYPYPHHTHRAEYETAGAFGTMMLSADIDALQYANHLCNQYGLDVISAGATVSFAMECYENGIITKEDTGGLELTWGNADAIIELLQLIGKREGIGKIFADGIKPALEKLGPAAEPFAMEVGGEELPMHDPKLQPEFFTTYKLDPTPARHTQYEGNARPPWGVEAANRDRTVYSGRGVHHKGASEYMHVVNATGMCQFIMMAGPNNRIPEWINLTTGWDTTPEEILKAGERIANLRMAFNIREGDIVTKRRIPDRLIGKQPLEAGPHEGVTLDTEALEKDFLQACDWDLETAKPSKAKLEELGLKDVAEAIQA
ncbi:MAG: aldehyde ferredoxin oxidoreductase family protein [Chloroflexi bacterium]|nr:aldehyde ferredoxin oxidoreductase family protein [Chloroflexota bacterium]